MAPQDAAPSWVKVGGRCRWWSESQKAHFPVLVTSVDPVKRKVVVHFEADHRVWKTVGFSHIGSTGFLRPPGGSSGETAAGASSAKVAPAGAAAVAVNGVGKVKSAPPATAVAGAAKDAKDKEKKDGTATPPWYEQLDMAEDREQVKDEHRRREEEAVAEQERRRAAWQQEVQKQAEEERSRREDERRRRELKAEADRLRILEKLKKEREEEQRRLQEVRFMECEEEVTARVNAVWRQREQVARRQREEEELAARLEEEARLQAKLEEELANRPRVSFGVRQQAIPQKILIPQAAPVVPVAAPAGSAAGWDTWAESAAQMETPPALASNLDLGAAPAAHGAPILSAAALAQEAPLSGGAWGAGGSLGLGLSSGSTATPAPAPAPPLQAPSIAVFYGAKIRAVYERHNPAKLGDVPGLLEKYAGCEAEMYERICEKYGVVPEPVPPELAAKAGAAAAAAAAKAAVGYAKKASAPAPPVRATTSKASAPPPPRDEHRRPPTASSLLARFQSLVANDGGSASSRSRSRGSEAGAASQQGQAPRGSGAARRDAVPPSDAGGSRTADRAAAPRPTSRGDTSRGEGDLGPSSSRRQDVIGAPGRSSASSGGAKAAAPVGVIGARGSVGAGASGRRADSRHSRSRRDRDRDRGPADTGGGSWPAETPSFDAAAGGADRKRRHGGAYRGEEDGDAGVWAQGEDEEYTGRQGGGGHYHDAYREGAPDYDYDRGGGARSAAAAGGRSGAARSRSPGRSHPAPPPPPLVPRPSRREDSGGGGDRGRAIGRPPY